MVAPMFRAKLEGHVTLQQITEKFEHVGSVMEKVREPEKVSLLVDATAMSEYDVEARDWFVSAWAPVHGGRVCRLAVVTTSGKFRLAIVAVGLAARLHGIRVKPFSDVAEAEQWAKYG